MRSRVACSFFLTVLLGVLFLAPGAIVISTASSGEVVVIGNKGLPDDVLAQEDLKKIFTGKKKFWSNRQKVVLATLNSSDTHNMFLKQFIRKNSSQYRNYWLNIAFAGKGKAPKSFKNEKELVKFVSQTSGAIGYISSRTDVNGAKVISIK